MEKEELPIFGLPENSVI